MRGNGDWTVLVLTAAIANVSLQSLYLIMETVMGGELFYYLQAHKGPLSESCAPSYLQRSSRAPTPASSAPPPPPAAAARLLTQSPRPHFGCCRHARFYVGCVALAFEFLQSKHLVYRDLKPENLLIHKDGYIKIADFSFVKRVKAGKTYTLCGTPAYLAPEQILRQGHDRAVDWCGRRRARLMTTPAACLSRAAAPPVAAERPPSPAAPTRWALGVLMYEMLTGCSPFYDRDDLAMFRKIVDVRCGHAAVAGRWLLLLSSPSTAVRRGCAARHMTC